MNLSLFAEDTQKQESGSPCYIGDEGSCFHVKRLGTEQTQKEVGDIKKALYGFAPKEIDNNLIMGHWLAEFGVTGWDEISDGDDMLEYSKMNALNIFTNEKYYLSLNQLLLNHATDYANYLFDETNEDVEAVKKS